MNDVLHLMADGVMVLSVPFTVGTDHKFLFPTVPVSVKRGVTDRRVKLYIDVLVNGTQQLPGTGVQLCMSGCCAEEC